jgi:hypothetical protein
MSTTRPLHISYTEPIGKYTQKVGHKIMPSPPEGVRAPVNCSCCTAPSAAGAPSALASLRAASPSPSAGRRNARTAAAGPGAAPS